MNFIKKIVDKKIDIFTHLQFQKFSRGDFQNRALIRAKNSNGKYTLFTSAEFANELVKFFSESLGNQKTRVTGGIISTINLKEIPVYSNLLSNSKVKQFQGVKNYLIDLDMTGKEISDMISAFPKAFFALSFNTPNSSLKIKPKAPKSGKPGSKGEEAPKADFCKIVTENKELINSFIFEKPDFKEAEINHNFKIEEIIIPEELKKSQDFAKIREESHRKGKIIRISKIDGQTTKKEIAFEA